MHCLMCLFARFRAGHKQLDPLKPINLPLLTSLEQFQGEHANRLLWVRVPCLLLSVQFHNRAAEQRATHNLT